MKTFAREADRAEIIRRVGLLRADCERRWGRMSVHQMVCHLSDGYRLMAGRRPTLLANSPLPRFIMRGIALYLPMKWPRSVPTTPDLDQAGGGSAPASFDTDAARLRQLLDDIATGRCGPCGGRLHPLFGPMSSAQWQRWAYLHADHHLRQFGL